jgi:hypothetical protein
MLRCTELAADRLEIEAIQRSSSVWNREATFPKTARRHWHWSKS